MLKKRRLAPFLLFKAGNGDCFDCFLDRFRVWFRSEAASIFLVV